MISRLRDSRLFDTDDLFNNEDAARVLRTTAVYANQILRSAQYYGLVEMYEDNLGFQTYRRRPRHDWLSKPWRKFYTDEELEIYRGWKKYEMENKDA